MTDYVITFFTHYDALVCQKLLSSAGLPGRLAPVPRKLSSSCGTCLMFSAGGFDPKLLDQAEIERLAQVTGDGEYVTLIDRL